MNLQITDEEAESTLFYPEKLSRRWEDDILIADTPDNQRLENYTSDPPKNFSRSISNRFGLVYEHPSGVRLILKSSGDIFSTANWIFGFELRL